MLINNYLFRSQTWGISKTKIRSLYIKGTGRQRDPKRGIPSLVRYCNMPVLNKTSPHEDDGISQQKRYQNVAKGTSKRGRDFIKYDTWLVVWYFVLPEGWQAKLHCTESRRPQGAKGLKKWSFGIYQDWLVQMLHFLWFNLLTILPSCCIKPSKYWVVVRL